MFITDRDYVTAEESNQLREENKDLKQGDLIYYIDYDSLKIYGADVEGAWPESNDIRIRIHFERYDSSVGYKYSYSDFAFNLCRTREEAKNRVKILKKRRKI